MGGATPKQLDFPSRPLWNTSRVVTLQRSLASAKLPGYRAAWQSNHQLGSRAKCLPSSPDDYWTQGFRVPTRKIGEH